MDHFVQLFAKDKDTIISTATVLDYLLSNERYKDIMKKLSTEFSYHNQQHLSEDKKKNLKHVF